MSRSDTCPLQTCLREATRTAHHRIDHHPLLAPLANRGLTRDQYAAALSALYRVQVAVEPLLRAASERWPAGSGFLPSPRTAWLEADLHALGHAPPRGADIALGAPASAAETVGMAYVIEGSTLGGRVLARQVAASLGLGTSDGAAYLNGHGEATAKRWTAFWRYAEAACPHDQTDVAVTAALRMFDFHAAVLDDARRS